MGSGDKITVAVRGTREGEPAERGANAIVLSRHERRGYGER